jgi:hypothetical protein
VRTVRVFREEDLAFSHMEYDYAGRKVGFDVLRFEDCKIVEHLDKLAQEIELAQDHAGLSPPGAGHARGRTGARLFNREAGE